MTPKVSAIIIVRDGERFIGEAIDSILAQEGPPLELLVVDDGSTDRTIEIVQSRGHRARLLHHPGKANLGMSASRNLGVAQARGEYIAFLDADDLWLPGKVADQVAILDAELQTALVYGRTLIWHGWDPGSTRADYFYELGLPPDVTYHPGRLFRQLLANRHQTPTTCNAMIRRDSWLAVGGADPALRGMFEDQLSFAKLLLRYPAHVSSRCWARYRQHDASASAAFTVPLTVDQLHFRYLAAIERYIGGSGGAPLRDRLALATAMARVGSRIAARKLKRKLRR